MGGIGGEVLIKSPCWIHPKKITFSQSLTPRILTEDDPIQEMRSGGGPNAINLSKTPVLPANSEFPA
jgi:hypothetical protein